MPYLFLRLLVALALWAGAGWAHGFVAEARAASPLLLTDNSEPWPLQESSMQWLEPGRNATAAQAWAAPFEIAVAPSRLELSAKGTQRVGRSLQIHNLGLSATDVAVRTLDWTLSSDGRLNMHDHRRFAVGEGVVDQVVVLFGDQVLGAAAGHPVGR